MGLKTNRFISSFLLAPLLIFSIFVPIPGKATPLDDYVTSVDSNYGYRIHQTVDRFGYTGFVLEMTSQKWRTTDEVDRTIWKHWVSIVVPDFVPVNELRRKALLFVVGADNDDPYDAAVVDYLAPIALAENAVAIAVEMVPNQPLLFSGESEPRSSDALIARSWAQFFATSDSNWIAQLPMTKSVVRAMDSVQHFCLNRSEPIVIDEFVVSGASKHGWTTWLSAAVDSRVTAIIPLVIDLLNMDASFRHHFWAYGFWAPAVSDYEMAGIFEHIGSPEMAELVSIIDPYVYRDRLEIPRFIVNSAGDEFFLPDSSGHYYYDLPPEGSQASGKYLRYIPNAGHSLNNTVTVETLSMYFHAALAQETLPQFSWTSTQSGTMQLQIGAETPSRVRLWQASNPAARDFRHSTIGNSWTSTELQDQGGGVYVGSVVEPPEGWTAFFIEINYPSGGLFDYAFTTDISIVPDYLPFGADIDFDGEREGDVNDDGRVNLIDVIVGLQVLTGRSVHAVQQADYDGDRKIGVQDCLYILNYIGNN